MAPATIRMDWHVDHLPAAIAPTPVIQPVLSSLNPTTGAADTTDAQIHCMGTDFANGAVVLFDATPQSTTFYDTTHLMALMTLPAAGSYSVLVRNPDGSESTPLTFTVN
jgi:hypothetical protein